MITDLQQYPLLPGSYPCAYRGHNPLDATGEIFKCEIHGRCSLVQLQPRLRACCACVDRREGGVGVQDSKPKLLGDMVESALKSAGITQERVTAWIGEECACDERREKLNQVHAWARGVLSGKIQKAKEYLEEVLTKTTEK